MGRKLDEDDVIRVMHERIVGVSESRAKIIASYIPTAKPSASDCWSNDNKTTDDSIDTKSSRYGTDRTTDGLISRAAAIDAINGLIDRFERILADIRETNVDESVCGLCEYDGAFMGWYGDWCNECPGFDKDDCFKLSDSCRERWLNSVKLPSAQPEPIRINLNEPIKVKLTDWGKEIYYHQYDRTHQIAGREIICKPRFPREDENGYTEFQLWGFMELYGEHMGMTLPNVIKPLEIVYEG